MKKIIITLFMSSLALIQAQQKPKLVIGIVIDQMKEEYLHRFENDFCKGGFKKLMKKGYQFKNMHYNYVPTYTAPGHASIYTGTTPAIHGIVGNSWYHKQKQKKVYCTDDANVETLGEKSKAGHMSPKNLIATTITDELKLFTNQKSKVFGVSIKDRGAILPAGHFADNAFWLSDKGNFISSTFYKDKLPTWVKDFNDSDALEKYMTTWDFVLPIENYTESIEDNNDYESGLGKKTPTLPYDLKAYYEKKGAKAIKSTPFGNDILNDFSKKMIEKEQLGQDNITDFITISFSSTDYVGHRFGPRSKEIQDTYIRLDRTLENLLKFLDKKVGKNNYLLFLTADHAVADNPHHLEELKFPIETLKMKPELEKIKKWSVEKFRVNVIEKFSNQNVFLNDAVIKKQNLNKKEVIEQLSDYLETFPFIKRAYTQTEILSEGTVDYLKELIFRGYDPKQNGEIVVALNPNWFVSHYGKTGTTHGSPYSYDTHVPAIFYGKGISPGVTYDRKIITQIAPTLARLLNVGFPSGTESKVLTEVLD